MNPLDEFHMKEANVFQELKEKWKSWRRDRCLLNLV